MRFSILILIFCMGVLSAYAQFSPPAGQAGSTALHKDSSIFIAWANSCSILRGYQDISDTSLGFANVGDSTMAVGIAGTNGVVSLGDSGHAILSFNEPIANGIGWDFAVFENSFSDEFLELAFVEVSSDGVNFFRFPATSLTQDSVQIGSFGSIDATKIDNLAGKYRALFGTPFDLQELSGIAGLNINSITHVKIIDVVGSVLPQYASLDQFGNIINDPWSTPFPSSGFDLDAVGVIHTASSVGFNSLTTQLFQMYPNPASGYVFIQIPEALFKVDIKLINNLGQTVFLKYLESFNDKLKLDVANLPEGIYILNISNKEKSLLRRLIIRHE